MINYRYFYQVLQDWWPNRTRLKARSTQGRKIVRKNNGIPRVVDLLDVDMNKVVTWWLWQDQLFKNTQEILLHTFKSVTSTSCTTLNVRQKIIPMMLRLNYPLTWRYNTSPPGVSSMISQPCYVTTMSMSPPSSSRLQGEEPMHCGPSADRNKTGN